MEIKVDWRRFGFGTINFVVPALLFYLMEFYEYNPFVEVRTEAAIFNVLILELLGWGLFFVCKNARISLTILSVITMLFGITNHYIMRFRSTPFVPWDLLSIKTAKSVANNYDFTPDNRMVVVTMIFLGGIIGLQFYRFKSQLKVYFRLGAAVVVFAMLCLFVGRLQDEQFQTKHHLYPFLFTPTYMTKVNGMVATFAMDLKYIAVEKPSGYSKKEAEETLSKYKETKGANAVIDEADYPNIIVIMDEAFSDLSVLSKFTTNEDYLPFTRDVLAGNVENTVSGYLNVSVCGGNTANTEFEFLTGNTMAFLPMGSIPYQQYIKSERQSLASHLKGLGYETYGMHPYGASGWNRDKIYPLLGLDNNLFINDFPNRRYIRNYVSDKSDFEQIETIYENKGDKPLFIFNVTMQNHGSYSEKHDNFTPDVAVESVKSSFSLNQYLSLVKRTDEQIERLLEYFTNQDEKTVIVFFGDHQPNDYTVSPINRAEEEYKRYQVPYFIWANYDIEEKTKADTSANYLAANLLSLLNMPTNEYQNYLLELEKKFPIISTARQEWSADASKEQLKEYQRLQYYNLFDWEGTPNE